MAMLIPMVVGLPRADGLSDDDCHSGPDGKLIQAKYFGKVRDDIKLDECSVSQLKVKANDGEPTES